MQNKKSELTPSKEKNFTDTITSNSQVNSQPATKIIVITNEMVSTAINIFLQAQQLIKSFREAAFNIASLQKFDNSPAQATYIDADIIAKEPSSSNNEKFRSVYKAQLLKTLSNLSKNNEASDDEKLYTFQTLLLSLNKDTTEKLYSYLYCSLYHNNLLQTQTFIPEVKYSLDLMQSMKDYPSKEKMIDLVARDLNTWNSHAK